MPYTCTIEGMGTAASSIADELEMLDMLAEHERRAAQLALKIAAVEASGTWAADGAVSFAAWLRHHGRLSNADASAWQRRGRFLRRFPAIGEAAATRVLSSSQVGFVRNACPAPLEPILEEQQEALVEILAPLDAAETQLACNVWNQRATAIIDTPPPTERERLLRFGADSTGAIVGNFVLPGQAGSEFAQAVKTATTWDGADDVRTTTEKQADALFEIAAFYNKNHEVPGTRGTTPTSSCRWTRPRCMTCRSPSTATATSSTPSPPTRCCVTARSTRSSATTMLCLPTAAASTPCPCRCSVPSLHETAAAASPGVTGRFGSVMRTTSSIGATAGRLTTTTCCCCAAAITTTSTDTNST